MALLYIYIDICKSRKHGYSKRGTRKCIELRNDATQIDIVHCIEICEVERGFDFELSSADSAVTSQPTTATVQDTAYNGYRRLRYVESGKTLRNRNEWMVVLLAGWKRVWGASYVIFYICNKSNLHTRQLIVSECTTSRITTHADVACC